jgi:hypothetical protein
VLPVPPPSPAPPLDDVVEEVPEDVGVVAVEVVELALVVGVDVGVVVVDFVEVTDFVVVDVDCVVVLAVVVGQV